MGEHGRPALGYVLVEQDARFGLAEQSCKRSLPVQEREIAQVLAVVLDQVERI
jgi:hypothetical protein